MRKEPHSFKALEPYQKTAHMITECTEEWGAFWRPWVSSIFESFDNRSPNQDHHTHHESATLQSWYISDIILFGSSLSWWYTYHVSSHQETETASPPTKRHWTNLKWYQHSLDNCLEALKPHVYDISVKWFSLAAACSTGNLPNYLAIQRQRQLHHQKRDT